MDDQLTLAQTHPMRLGGQTVAEYTWRPHLPNTLSPRPFLHPVRTLTGTTVTEAMPPDHLHHLGVSIAVPDVAGANFWGGRTYVHGQGSTPLPNHGIQRHHRWEAQTDTVLTHELRWLGPDGTPLLRERRRIAARPLDHRAWALDCRFALRNLTPEPLRIASPATNGRTGAGYGGFFWRARGAPEHVRVLGPGIEGADRLHGTRTPWIALSANNSQPWTLIFTTDSEHRDPWFVRSNGYIGVGASLAWSKPLTAEPGTGPQRRIITVVADGALDPREIPDLVEAVAANPAPGERR